MPAKALKNSNAINRKGRPPGSPNKATVAVKEAILQAFNEAHKDGPVAYLKDVAEKDPKTFLALVGKLIPKEITGEVRVNHIQTILAELTGKTAEDQEDKPTIQ